MLTVFGTTLSVAVIAAAMLIAALPVWLAAKFIGAGRSELWRCAVALLLATALCLLLLKVLGVLSVLLWPVTFIVVFSRLLDTSMPGAFVLCVLALAIQAFASKAMSAMA